MLKLMWKSPVIDPLLAQWISFNEAIYEVSKYSVHNKKSFGYLFVRSLHWTMEFPMELFRISVADIINAIAHVIEAITELLKVLIDLFTG